MVEFLYKIVLIMRELLKSSLFLSSVAVLVFGFALALWALALPWMVPNLFWFIVGISVSFLVMAGLQWLSRDAPPPAAPHEEADRQSD